MPINIKATGSIHEVEQELRSFETQYQMTTAEFAAHTSIEDVVSEFDAIEWNFLLMQKRAFEEDRREPTLFSSRTPTQTGTVDVCDMYDLVAA
jgi:hypothetical protein